MGSKFSGFRKLFSIASNYGSGFINEDQEAHELNNEDQEAMKIKKHMLLMEFYDGAPLFKEKFDRLPSYADLTTKI